MIQYQCGRCRAEMESPDVMKGKVEVCPSCETLIRVPSKARFGSTVRCANCHKDFSREDKVKLYNRELVCDKCAAFLEGTEKVVLPEATDEDVAAPPPRTSYYDGLGCLIILFGLSMVVTVIRAFASIAEIVTTSNAASRLDSVFVLAWCSAVIWVSVLFFRQKRSAPIAIVALFIVEGFLIGLAVLMGYQDWALLAAWIIVRAPFIPYLLLSKRTKETFVR